MALRETASRTLRKAVLVLAGIAALVAGPSEPCVAEEIETPGWVKWPDSPKDKRAFFYVDDADGRTVFLEVAKTKKRLSDVKLEGGELSFTWEYGSKNDCKLLRQPDGSWKGDCHSSQDELAATLTLMKDLPEQKKAEAPPSPPAVASGEADKPQEKAEESGQGQAQ